MGAVYLVFFHGRNSPTEKLPAWGFDGPIIGPVELQITYGSWRVGRDGGWLEEVEIPFEKGCARIGDKYYGDVSVMPTGPKEGGQDFDRLMTFKQLKHEMETTDYGPEKKADAETE